MVYCTAALMRRRAETSMWGKPGWAVPLLPPGRATSPSLSTLLSTYQLDALFRPEWAGSGLSHTTLSGSDERRPGQPSLSGVRPSQAPDVAGPSRRRKAASSRRTPRADACHVAPSGRSRELRATSYEPATASSHKLQARKKLQDTIHKLQARKSDTRNPEPGTRNL